MRQSVGIAKILAGNIKRLRKDAAISQELLAEKIGASWPTITAWENENRWPGLEHIAALSKFFKVTESALFADPDAG